MRRMWPHLAAWTLAVVLVWAGSLKALNPGEFAENIMSFRLVPRSVAAGLAFYVPWLELTVAAGLVVPRWRAGALLITSVLMTVFVAVWAITWIRGVDVSCGCFGEAGRSPAAWSLVRALLFALISWVALTNQLRRRDSITP